mgnify:CR=1 FL=1
MGRRLRLYKIMAKTLAMSIRSWHKLKDKIADDYGRTTVLISWKLRENLGFTVREHRDFTRDEWRDDYIRLDFWDDYLQTMFLLKYSDYLAAKF